MRKRSEPGSVRAYTGELHSRVVAQSNPLNDPFSINPIRRSFIGATVSMVLITIPFLISAEVGATVMLSVGWLAMAIIVFCVPIFIWSVAEEVVRIISPRIHPPVSELDLPLRIIHILQRHNVGTIRAAERLDPAAFHLMANMAPRDAESIVRAINLWRYRRWQEAGFPAEGAD